MKRSLIAFAGALFVVAVGWLYVPVVPIVAAGPTDDKGVEELITQLERSWAAAIVNKDIAALDRLIATEFNGTSPNAHFYSKEIAIGDLKRGTYVVEKMDLDEISVNVYGNTAVAFTSQDEKSWYANVAYSGHYHYTDVWVKKNGRWQVVASHGSRFDATH
jgi:ketosteroid isomerase-like protein